MWNTKRGSRLPFSDARESSARVRFMVVLRAPLKKPHCTLVPPRFPPPPNHPRYPPELPATLRLIRAPGAFEKKSIGHALAREEVYPSNDLHSALKGVLGAAESLSGRLKGRWKAGSQTNQVQIVSFLPVPLLHIPADSVRS